MQLGCGLLRLLLLPERSSVLSGVHYNEEIQDGACQPVCQPVGTVCAASHNADGTLEAATLAEQRLLPPILTCLHTNTHTGIYRNW